MGADKKGLLASDTGRVEVEFREFYCGRDEVGVGGEIVRRGWVEEKYVELVKRLLEFFQRIVENFEFKFSCCPQLGLLSIFSNFIPDFRLPRQFSQTPRSTPNQATSRFLLFQTCLSPMSPKSLPTSSNRC
jgi:hypothetical protein